jgi:hypothetical protein
MPDGYRDSWGTWHPANPPDLGWSGPREHVELSPSDPDRDPDPEPVKSEPPKRKPVVNSWQGEPESVDDVKGLRAFARMVLSIMAVPEEPEE